MIETKSKSVSNIGQVAKAALVVVMISALLTLFIQIPKTNAWFTDSVTGSAELE